MPLPTYAWVDLGTDAVDAEVAVLGVAAGAIAVGTQLEVPGWGGEG